MSNEVSGNFDHEDLSGYENNACIKEAVDEMLNEPSPEAIFKILCVIRKRIAEEGEAPTPMVSEHVLNKDLGFGSGSKLLIDTVFDEDGNEWYPLYTDESELNSGHGHNAVIDLSIAMVLEKAFDDDRVKGVAINPFSQKMLLSKQAIEVILGEWAEDIEVS